MQKKREKLNAPSVFTEAFQERYTGLRSTEFPKSNKFNNTKEHKIRIRMACVELSHQDSYCCKIETIHDGFLRMFPK